MKDYEHDMLTKKTAAEDAKAIARPKMTISNALMKK